MNRILIVSLLLLISIVEVTAQKRGTPFGDVWDGNIVAANEATRELTIEYMEKDQPVKFTGILKEDYKIWLVDRSNWSVKFSEIPIGTRVRLHAKKEEQKVGADKVKIFKISRIEILGKDEYARLRAILNVPPDVAVEMVKPASLPSANPLKIYAHIESPSLTKTFLKWANVWNETQGAKHGAVEVASTFKASDVSLVVYGADLMVLGSTMYKDGQQIEFENNMMRLYTAYLVRSQEGKLELLWIGKVFPLAEPTARGVIEKELEKKLKVKR